MKYDKLKKEKLFGIGRWLVLGILVLCAGCFYSCGDQGEEADLIPAAETGFWGEGQKPFGEEAVEEPGFESREAEAGPEVEGQGGKEIQAEKAGLETELAETAEAKIPEKEMPEKGMPEQETLEPETAEPESVPVCYVYVCGQVHQPGVYVLEEGQRIFEAVEMAGGFTAEAADGYLNLAAAITDGMKIQVPDKTQAADPKWQQTAGMSDTASAPGSLGGTGSMEAGSSQPSAKVNLNTATKEELMTLTGVGQSRAEDIIRYREKNGGFARIEDIMKVSGIKEASFEKIKDQITV